MSHDVFISYSNHDKLAADAACSVLEQNGVRCWIAPRDGLPGQLWSQSVLDAIKDSKLVVLILSDKANASPEVVKEIDLALSYVKPVIPFRIENVAPAGSLEYHLKSRHWLDAFPPPVEQHMGRLVDHVRVLMGQEAIPAPKVAKGAVLWKIFGKYVGLTTIPIVIAIVVAGIIINVRGHDMQKPRPSSWTDVVAANNASGEAGARRSAPNCDVSHQSNETRQRTSTGPTLQQNVMYIDANQGCKIARVQEHVIRSSNFSNYAVAISENKTRAKVSFDLLSEPPAPPGFVRLDFDVHQVPQNEDSSCNDVASRSETIGARQLHAGDPNKPDQDRIWARPSMSYWSMRSDENDATFFDVIKSAEVEECDGEIAAQEDRPSTQIFIPQKSCHSAELRVRRLPSCDWLPISEIREDK